jgi:FkbM family methyltransferase
MENLLNLSFKTSIRVSKANGRLTAMSSGPRVWIDVGAHLGESTFLEAQRDPSLLIYAFEPNLSLFLQRTGMLPNWIVLPYAVAESEGTAPFHLNYLSQTSSLLPLYEPGRQSWLGGEELRVERTQTVPVIRLDTFMDLARISEVEYLKIGAQGSDFGVLKSAGERIRGIRKITLEVQITPVELYSGAAGRQEILDYLAAKGFELVECRRQTFDQEENLTFLRC